jgi:endonuclease/exonuclease/phosphatase family metal-dependent hydrolase
MIKTDRLTFLFCLLLMGSVIPATAQSQASPSDGATNVSTSTIVSWTPAIGAVSYDVRFGTSNPPPLVSNSQGTTYQPPTLAYNKTYFWRIDAKRRKRKEITIGPVWSFTTAAPPPPNPTPTNLDRLRVMTWNVGSSRDLSGTPSIDAQVATIADSRAHVVGLQEVEISAQYGDLPALYKSKLESLTGSAWYSVWIPEPRPTSVVPMGNLILSRLPIVLFATTEFDTAPWDETLLDAKRAAGQIMVNVNSVLVNILVTHLAVDTSQRQTQLDLLQTWASSFSTPRLVGGNLNMMPGDAAYNDLSGGFKDAWRTMVGTTDAGFTTDATYIVAPSQPGRVDYWWHELSDTHVAPTEAFVIQTSLSAHRPVVIDVNVR